MTHVGQSGKQPAVGRGRKTSQQDVIECLRDSILTGRLPGGTRLIQSRIAAELGVSRVPVREALLQLSAEHMVTMEPHVGATVVWHSPAQVSELFGIRAALVREAAILVVPELSESHLNTLAGIVQQQDCEGSATARHRLNRAFYASLFEDLRRPRLLSMIDQLENELARYLQSASGLHLPYGKLMEMLRAKEGEEAAALLADHLRLVGHYAARQLESLLDSGQLRRPSVVPKRVRRVASFRRRSLIRQVGGGP